MCLPATCAYERSCLAALAASAQTAAQAKPLSVLPAGPCQRVCVGLESRLLRAISCLCARLCVRCCVRVCVRLCLQSGQEVSMLKLWLVRQLQVQNQHPCTFFPDSACCRSRCVCVETPVLVLQCHRLPSSLPPALLWVRHVRLPVRLSVWRASILSLL